MVSEQLLYRSYDYNMVGKRGKVRTKRGRDAEEHRESPIFQEALTMTPTK